MPKGKTRSLYAKNSIFGLQKYGKLKKGCSLLSEKNPQSKPMPELRIYLSIGVYSILASSSVASTRFEDGNLNFLHNSELSVSQFGCKVNKKQSRSGRNLLTVPLERKIPQSEPMPGLRYFEDCFKDVTVYPEHRI